ncbi:hypothetical protein V7S43_000793 [Phytophthora oleae]|uniref:RxLR effector protein n=1 Tax=Phytophthora oleae TaxID=2107226 RepID=A0ABD3G6R8_9STRA
MMLSRLYIIALLVVAVVSTCGATIDSEQAPAFKNDRSSRHLRARGDVPKGANTEERSPNIDIMISDAAKKVKKATWWKVKFAVWKHLLRKDPHQARGDLGMRNMGREVFQHKNYKQLRAFTDYYGKGPLKYD